jgi:hypothetical protein
MKIAVVVLLLVSSPAFAAETSIPAELKVCASIKRNTERLSCYDRAMGALAAGKEATAALPAAAEASFGVSANKEVKSKPEIAERGDVDSVTANVKSFGHTDDGSRVFNLDNGQKWRQIDTKDPLLKAGDAVTIKRAALGSFQMFVPTGRAIKVRRIS